MDLNSIKPGLSGSSCRIAEVPYDFPNFILFHGSVISRKIRIVFDK